MVKVKESLLRWQTCLFVKAGDDHGKVTRPTVTVVTRTVAVPPKCPTQHEATTTTNTLLSIIHKNSTNPSQV